MQRTLITVGLLLCALGITVAVVLNDPAKSRPAPAPAPSPSPTSPPEKPSPEDPAPKPPSVTPSVPVEAIEGLKVIAAPEAQAVQELGGKDLDDPDYFLSARFSPWGGGIKQIRLLHHRTKVDEPETYTAQQQLAKWQNDPATKFPQYRYSMAAFAITVNGATLDLAAERWRVVADNANRSAAAFEIDLADGQDRPVLRIRRTWHLGRQSHDLRLRQSFENLGERPLEIRFSQFGPSELPSDGGYIGDQRKVTVGYLEKRGRGADAYHILSTEDFSLPRGKVIGDEYYDTVWPAQDPEPDRHITWLAMSNRYFAAALFTPLEVGQNRPRRLETQFERVRRLRWKTGEDYEEGSTLAVVLDSVPLRLAPADGAGASAQLGVDLFVGPKDPA
ncbi:MAG: YidC/Oxa1 family insertase periplasmic-domain containing protein, partial [Phycisphaerae bacterium]|nr:YidC/Oxa1 family insertase periplasmic-domain containing protein [Phycisphaerae bacterium]